MKCNLSGYILCPGDGGITRSLYYNPDSLDRDVLELIVGKARHGETGTARCLFDKSYGLLTNLPEGKDEER
ncbi:hypothetical protein [Microcystis aeruginosa]|uniref:hypothetical protein n=1 Tax=Microcystis aeruginosa TaxID=1126 RepID=UPI0011EA7033|nr:hypothetical protein [Microcystis aeruginosa]